MAGRCFVAQAAHCCRLGTNESDASVSARIHKFGIFGQQAVTGVDRVGADIRRDADHFFDAEVGGDWTEPFTNAVGFVGFETVQAQLVFFRKHGDGFLAHLVGGPHDADGDFTPIGDKDFLKVGHGNGPLFCSCSIYEHNFESVNSCNWVNEGAWRILCGEHYKNVGFSWRLNGARLSRMSSYSDEDAFEAASAPKQSLSQRAMAAPVVDYFEGLNPAQREAVETLDGPVLMLAGAGTGKTKALTCRIAHLLATSRARPDEILAVTFTNKAAREMKVRIGALTNGASEGMRWLGTFHAICVKQLRRHAELVGLKSSFTILDTDDQLRLLKQLVRASDIDEKRWPPRMLAGIIDGWKNKAWTPAQVPTSEAAAFDHKGIELYTAYQARLIELNACDFGDLLLHMVTIFQTHEDVLKNYQRWSKYILVDEYQDTNVAQYLWLRLLAQGHKNICCVGDDDQSIYGWRGAEVGNILRFENDFEGAHVVRLEQNYRSTGHILGAAAGVIDANTNRLGKTLFTAGEDGEQVRLIGHYDGNDEARWIGEEIEAMQLGTRHLDPIPLNDMAILVRASHQMRAFEDRFLTIGLPYRVIGGPRFYERLEIRDAMAYFRLAVSQDDDLAFERIVNTPKRGLGDKAVQTIQMTARSHGVNLVEGARICVDSGAIKGKGAGGVARIGARFGSLASTAAR